MGIIRIAFATSVATMRAIVADIANRFRLANYADVRVHIGNVAIVVRIAASPLDDEQAQALALAAAHDIVYRICHNRKTTHTCGEAAWCKTLQRGTIFTTLLPRCGVR